MLSCPTRLWEAGVMSLGLVAALSLSLWVPEMPTPFQQLLFQSWPGKQASTGGDGFAAFKELVSRHGSATVSSLRFCHCPAAAVPTG